MAAIVTTLNAEVLDGSTELTKLLQACILSNVIGTGGRQVDVQGEIYVTIYLGTVFSGQQRIVTFIEDL